MTENQAVDILLSTERDINSRIHSAITEILRKGYENVGKEQMESIIDSIRYVAEQTEMIIDRRG